MTSLILVEYNPLTQSMLVDYEGKDIRMPIRDIHNVCPRLGSSQEIVLENNKVL